MPHPAIFFLSEVEGPVINDFDELFQKGSAGKDLAVLEAFVIFEQGLMDENSPVRRGFESVEGVVGTRGYPDALGFVGKIIQRSSFDDSTAGKQNYELRPLWMLVPRGPFPFAQGHVERIEKNIFVDEVFIPVARIPRVFAQFLHKIAACFC